MARRFVRNNDLVEREIRKEHILVPLVKSSEKLDSIFTLDEVASMIWKDAVAGFNENEIAHRLTVDYDIDLPTAETDCRRLLDQFISLGMLRPEDD